MNHLVAVAVVMVSAARARAGGRPDRTGGPDHGTECRVGEQMERGAALAVADLNAAGGVLGQQVQLITADDFCDPEQAVAAANKLVSDGVIFVVGHFCSGPRSRRQQSTRRRES